MQLDDAESELLKTWVVKRLEDISDADSDVLADYVLALIRSEESDDAVRQNCLDNLQDFLHDHTTAFVNDVFSAISTKSYLPSQPSQPVSKPLAPTAPSFNPLAPTAPAFNPPSGPAARKRGFNDADAFDQQPFARGQDRPVKQMRRGGRGGGIQRGASHMGSMPTPPPGMPPFDPNNPLAAILAMQAMGMPGLPGMPQMPQMPFSPSPGPFGQQAQAPRSGQRCHDYDTKGFCALGASCPHEHGNDPLVVPQHQADEYDPSNASISQGRSTNERGRGRGRGRGDRGAFRGGRGGRAEFSSAGPNHDRSITQVVIEQIPEENFNEQSVRDFFSEFGTIESVELQTYKRLAIIKFEDYDGAKRAYDSPKVIFDNRFVKVYWYKPDRLPRERQQNGGPGKGDGDVEMQEEEKIDPVEFAKKQEEAQRAHEEKTRKIKEAEAAREELEAKMKAQAEERSKLLAKLAAKERAKSGTPDQAAGQNGADGPKTQSATDALKAKLAELEKEAESIGINPNEEAWQGFPTRGRGGYRGRGAYVPRGAWRGGRGAFAPRGGAVRRLDNRPKTVAVIFPNNEEMGPEKDEALRQYLLFNDLIESTQITPNPSRPDSAVLTFSERFQAEKFINHGTEIPHIGKIEWSWLPNAVPVAAAPGAEQKDVVMDEGVQAQPQVQDLGNRAQEMDYDVADDDDAWLN